MGNASKEYWGELNQPVEHSHRRLKVPATQEVKEDKVYKMVETNSANSIWKLKETLDRFKQNNDQREKKKVQQLG